MSGFVVAIDGPAGAGKSTVAKGVAQRAGLTLVDTGAIYRAVALASHREGIDAEDAAALGALAERLEIGFRLDDDGQNRTLLGGEDVSDAIREPDNSMRASTVSKHPPVRAALLELQRELGKGGAVLEGRDIGTVVFPDAPLKIFLSATAEARAQRRTKELEERGTPRPYDEILAEIVARDAQDQGRAAAPLVAAADAVAIDSTAFTADEVIEQIVKLVVERRG